MQIIIDKKIGIVEVVLIGIGFLIFGVMLELDYNTQLGIILQIIGIIFIFLIPFMMYFNGVNSLTKLINSEDES